MQEGVLKAERTDGTTSPKPPLTLLGLLHGTVLGGEPCAARQQRLECPPGGMQEKVFEPGGTGWTRRTDLPRWPQ